ncbi:MAG: hypothetical protein FJZ47_23125, partial [Candidatus Tectomicrobia bacterium]|nr:hypothetical protein [Candidatus Tectomicrobia bacterium]
MALKALDPSLSATLPHGWQLVASEAGRSSQGLRATVALWNGTARACQTLALGDHGAQHTLITLFAGLANLPPPELAQALTTLTVAVEGTLRQMETQGANDDKTQAQLLVDLAVAQCTALFHTPEGEAYASLPVEGHTETWLLRVKGFRRWLARLFYDARGKIPGGQALHDALTVLEGEAQYKGAEHPVFTRLAAQGDVIYLDMGNPQWQAVEVTAQGWRVLDQVPVKFRRARGMLPLPVPTTGGSLALLRDFLNLGSDEDWYLLVAWLLAALRPSGPYPVLVLYGEQGSAKSTQVRVLRSLLDPNAAALRTTPRD